MKSCKYDSFICLLFGGFFLSAFHSKLSAYLRHNGNNELHFRTEQHLYFIDRLCRYFSVPLSGKLELTLLPNQHINISEELSEEQVNL